MPYLHEVVEQADGLYMSHHRLSTTASGLSAVEEIARTFPVVSAPEPRRAASKKIRAANQLETETFGTPPAIVPLRIDTIECAELNEFTQKGVDRWRQLAKKLGKVWSIELRFAEEYYLHDRVTPGGVVLPKPEAEFIGYYATLSEMSALMSMTKTVDTELYRASPSAGYL